MLRINTNINSRTHYDEDGSQFVSGMPKMFFRSKETVVWQLYSETPGLDENETPDEVWTKFTGYEGMTGINAYLTADNNYTHRMKGTLDEAVPTTPTIITATVPGAGFNLIPEHGTVNLFDKEGHYESIQYSAREIDGNTVVFQMDGTPTLNRAYDAGWVMDVGEEVYMQATLDYQQSDVSSGLFVFEITAYSEKLRQSIVYSDVESVPIRGLELAIFQVLDARKQDIDRYVVTTFKIMSGIAETDLDPVLPPEHQNDAALMVETLLASGFQIQYSTDGENWTDTQHPEDEEISSSDSSSSSVFYPYEYFRFRSASVGGTWSQPIRIRNGRDGEDGIRGNRITQGTAITGTSTTPSPYPTGIAMSYMNDLYINPQTQYVYQCVQDGDEETALWIYTFCLKGEAFDAIDNETITENSNSELQSIGFRESNKAVAQRVWIGTLEEYVAQGKANSPDICIITDDDSNSDSEFSPEWIIDEIDGKQNIAREVISSTSPTLTVVPNKVYEWNPVSSGVISFDHTDYFGKHIEIPIFLTLTGNKTIAGSTASSTAVTVEGNMVSGEWRLVWDGTRATFKEFYRQIDSELSDSSSNAVQNKTVTRAINEKQNILMGVVSSTSNTLTVSPGNAYTWTPAENGMISFDHTGLIGKSTIIPVKLVLGEGITIIGSTAAASAVTVEGVPQSGYWELIWDGSTAVLRNPAVRYDESSSESIPEVVSSYLYIAYASSSTGEDFSLTPSVSLKYVATLISHTEIQSPTATDFAGATWVKYIGENGSSGTSSYLYIAYATNSSGSGWTRTPDTSHPYLATKISSTPLTPTSSDFSGATWVKYIGSDGQTGTRGSRINYGTAVTGTSTTPAAYPTGISDSLVNDLYLNTSLGNIYQCTTAGDASTARWVFACTMRAQDESDSSLIGVSLNGEDIVPENRIADVKALPIVSALPSLVDTTQDVVLYKGEDDATANPPMVRGHVYGRDGAWSDSTITVKFGSNTQVLTKVGTSNVWNDTGAPGYETYQISHNGTNWVFDYSSFLYNSPACPATTMPWDDAISGAIWTEQGDEGTLTVYVTRAYNGSWVDLSAQGGDAEYLPVVKTMPTASATSEDIVFYGGEDATGVEKGHIYEKHVDYDDSTLGINWSGWTETLTKNQSGGWSNQYNTLSYSSTNGWWSFSNDYDNGQHSSQCDNTVMPWDPSLTWYNNGGSIPITVTFTLAVPPTYSWNDISVSGNEIQLNGKTQTPVNKQVNIMALPIVIDSMPEASKDAQPYILYLGETSGSVANGHLYQLTKTVDDSSITVEINGLAVFMTGGSGSWTNQEVSPTMNLYYSNNVGAWVLERGFNYTSPQCPSTTMPWDPSLSGQTWNYQSYGSITPIISDPTVYSWTDRGSMLGS